MKNNSHIDQANRTLLLIGDSSGIFTSKIEAEKRGIEYCNNMLDAVRLATKTKFVTIAVVLADTDAILNSALKTLKQLQPDAKIILLAKMHEEPRAMQLIRSYDLSSNFADDYYICPISPAQFFPPQTKDTDHKQIIDQKQPPQKKTPPPQSQEQTKRLEILEKLATEDELTGIKNRRYVREFLRQIIRWAQKEDLQVTLLIFDIDDFKSYNDLYGHSTGDTILKQAAILMQKCCRKQDVVSRIGGDEFAVVFWNSKNRNNQQKDNTVRSERRALQSHHLDEATIICERFRSQINSTPLPALGVTGKGKLSISGGLAAFPRDGKNVVQLFEQADKALLEAKRSGKNRVLLVGRETPDVQ